MLYTVTIFPGNTRYYTKVFGCCQKQQPHILAPFLLCNAYYKLICVVMLEFLTSSGSNQWCVVGVGNCRNLWYHTLSQALWDVLERGTKHIAAFFCSNRAFKVTSSLIPSILFSFCFMLSLLLLLFCWKMLFNWRNVVIFSIAHNAERRVTSIILSFSSHRS